ncbi:hypothetical protein V501_07527 [Pseudogymnoascus sp. VKM F-4519 (FW-2642)]|nr:hypothetical protein V501_07527 [Pseudogymnoascus sp. VKM F-4519 (FW-2642)]
MDIDEEREEQRRRENEEMEMETLAASWSGASFDSGVAPVMEGMVGEGAMEMVMKGMTGGVDEILGMGTEMEVGVPDPSEERVIWDNDCHHAVGVVTGSYS